jgi:hypothetical protein
VPTVQLASTVVAGALGAGLAVALVGASFWFAVPAVLGVTFASIVAGRNRR